MNYFTTSDSIQYSWHCVEILDIIMLAATGKDANFTVEEFDELITVDYCRDL